MREQIQRFLPPMAHLHQLGLLADPPGQLVRTVLLPSTESPRHEHIRTAALARGYAVASGSEGARSSAVPATPRWLGFYGCTDGAPPPELPDAVHAIIEVQGATMATTAPHAERQRL